MNRTKRDKFLFLDVATCRETLKAENPRKVAFVYHLRISEPGGYQSWLARDLKQFGGKRLYRVKVDPVPREGMHIDEILIEEYASARAAIAYLSKLARELTPFCDEYTVLAIEPEPAITFWMVMLVSRVIRFFKGVTDHGTPTTHWRADNNAVWPDDDQMQVARQQNLDNALFVYNLNQYKSAAEYKGSEILDAAISGKEAYDRYARIAGFELLRRGAFPVYGGKPLCLFGSSEACMLADHWDHFVFVRYPQRRNLLAMTESEAFRNGQHHRNAGLERVAIFMGEQAR